MNDERFEREFKQYLETALWSSTDHDFEPLDGLYFVDDIADECLGDLRQEFKCFCDEIEHIINAEPNIDVGHNFWLTRNGHGAGFWDRGYKHGDELTALSKNYGSCDVYVGDDNMIYFN